MDYNLLITLSVYFLFIISLVIGFFVGFKRGLIKSSIRFGLLILFFIIAGLITPPISSAISQIDISGLNWEINGNVAKTLPEGFKALILSNQEINQAASEMPSISKIIEGLPSVIISILVFIILALLCSIISWVIYLIIQRFALKQSRLEKQYKKIENKKKKENSGQLIKPNTTQIILPKKNKYKWWGGAVGLICGFVFIFVVLIPITSLSSTISEISSNDAVNAESSNDITNSEMLMQTSSDLLNYYIGENNIATIKAYGNSVPGKILTLGGLDDAIFDSITKININNKGFSFRYDILNIAKTYDEIIYLIDEIGSYENYSMVDFNKVQHIIDKIFSLGIFNILVEEATPYALNYLYDSKFFVNLEYNQNIKDSLNNIVEDLKSSKLGFVTTLKDDLNHILNILKTVFEIGLIDDLVGGNRDINTFVSALQKDNNKLVNSLTENITSSYSLKNILISSVNIGFTFLEEKTDNQLKLEFLDKNLMDWNQTSTSLFNIIVNGLEIYTILDKYDITNIINNPKLLTYESFNNSDFENLITKVAKELQLFKTSPLLVSSNYNNYNNLVDYFSTIKIVNNLIDSNQLKTLEIENEILKIKQSLVLLKSTGLLNYLLNNRIYIDEIFELLVKNNNKHETYISEILKPILDSQLSQKPVKYALQLFNDNIDSFRKNLGEELKEINLSNFEYLSVNDKTQIINVLENCAKLINITNLKSYIDNPLKIILSINDINQTGELNSKIYVDILNSLSNISLINETYKSFFEALSKSENYSNYFSFTQIDKINWEYEFIKINKILEILKTEINNNSVIDLIFPNETFEQVTITDELITNILNILKQNVKNLNQNTYIGNLVQNLYESNILNKTLVYIINILNEQIENIISSEENPITISELSLSLLVEDNVENIVKVFESLANCYEIFVKKDFSLKNLDENEINKIGSFLNCLKENAYKFENGKPNPSCELSPDKNTLENGGVFSELYLGLIKFAKQTFDFSEDVSYSEIDWVNFLKTAKKLSELSENNNSLLEIIADDNIDINLSETLEIIGVNKETTEKINEIQNSFNDVKNSHNFEELSKSLENITQEDIDSIKTSVEQSTGYNITNSINIEQINNEKIVSNRINYLLTHSINGIILGLTDQNVDDSLSDLCNGASVVLQKAVSSNVKISCNISGGIETLQTKIEEKTNDENIQRLVLSLFK